jgi:hypothetical protein
VEQFAAYFSKALSGCKPFIGGLIGALNYILFPAEAFRTAAMALGVAMLLDILTKYVTLSREARGFMKAVKTGRIRSEALWYGTKIKLYSYLVIAILAGLSYRVVQLEQLSVFFASVVYSVLFLREAQSILENLCDGGADLRWALVWARKKERDILDQDVEDPEEPKEGI